MPEILVSEKIEGDAMDRLCMEFEVMFEPNSWKNPDHLSQLIRNVRAIIVRNQTQVTAGQFAASPKLEIVGRAGAGLDNIDVEAATEAGVVVTSAARENSLSVAEFTIGLMLCLARKIPGAHADTRQGSWNRTQFVGSELSEKILGIVGMGRIGMLVAQRAQSFGMSILAHDDYVDPEIALRNGLDVRMTSLNTLLSRADFVSCHVSLTDGTRNMFNAERFQKMKSTAMFINASRGEVVDEMALFEMLQDKKLAGAALDVRGVEPPASSLLREFDNVIQTPHIAAFTVEAQQRVVAAICRDVTAVLRGGEALNGVNFPRPLYRG